MAPATIMTITRCPDCQTAFRITEAQRAAAEGLVRCGACTRVFQADHHLVGEESPGIGMPSPGGESGHDIEEDYIRALLGEATQPSLDACDVHAGESPAPEGNGMDLTGVESTPVPEASGEEVAVRMAVEAAEPAMTAQPDPAAEPDQATEPESGQEQEEEPEQDSGVGTLASFAPPPVEIEATPPRRRLRTLGWALGCILALLVLVAQYGWHERTRLLEAPHIRLGLERACLALGCTLPPRPAAPDAIRGEALLIRSAPDRDGVLLVDALLSNRAAHPQPWPGLAISFQDLHGRTVAGRVFNVDEYLPEAPRAEMPSGTPIAVHLELRDPGDRAAGYRMDIVTPDTRTGPEARRRGI